MNVDKAIAVGTSAVLPLDMSLAVRCFVRRHSHAVDDVPEFTTAILFSLELDALSRRARRLQLGGGAESAGLGVLPTQKTRLVLSGGGGFAIRMKFAP